MNSIIGNERLRVNTNFGCSIIFYVFVFSSMTLYNSIVVTWKVEPQQGHNSTLKNAKKTTMTFHNHSNVVEISEQCQRFHQNSSKVEMFCKDTLSKKCQSTATKRERQQLPKNNNKNNNNNNNNSTSSCKTLWITCIGLEFEEMELWGDGYEKEYKVALQSAMHYAGDTLQPVLVIFNGSRLQQSPQPNTTTLSKDEELPKLGVWAQSMGVKVVQVYDLSFQDLVFEHYADYRTNGKIAYYTRLDIPNFVDEYRWFDEPGICSRHVFYTDVDVVFLNPFTRQDMLDLKQRLVGEKFIMYGQDFLIRRPKPSNTGVMLIDVEGFAKEWPNILSWGKMQTTNNFPEHDQLWLNRYYSDPRKWKRQNELLPTYYNWKVYWQLEPNNNLYDIQIVHFHGPKPGVGVEAIAECNLEAWNQLTHPIYQSLVQHAICCDSGKTANSIISIYNQWLHNQ